MRIDDRGPVGSITLSRPEKLNALSPTMLTELADAARHLDACPEVKVVVVAGEGRAFCAEWGGIPRLVRELGPAVTKELVLTCRQFGAEEARALRFVNRVEAPEALAEAVASLADELAAKPGFALRTTKQQVNAVLEEIAGTARNAADADILQSAVHDPECQAATAAYVKARRPASA